MGRWYSHSVIWCCTCEERCRDARQGTRFWSLHGSMWWYHRLRGRDRQRWLREPECLRSRLQQGGEQPYELSPAHLRSSRPRNNRPRLRGRLRSLWSTNAPFAAEGWTEGVPTQAGYELRCLWKLRFRFSLRASVRKPCTWLTRHKERINGRGNGLPISV